MARRIAREDAKQAIPYNPLDKRNLGESVAEALLTSSLGPIPPAERFSGAGVYAIYYHGANLLYERLVSRNCRTKPPVPVYVGKATPKGGRKGLEDAPERTYALYERLSKHAATIRRAINLKIEEFQCRYLVVDDIWIPLGESLLIRRFAPVWNCALDGFGNNAPGSGRKDQQKSPWHVVHPGEPWAEKLSSNRRTLAEFQRVVRDYLEKRYPVEE